MMGFDFAKTVPSRISSMRNKWIQISFVISTLGICQLKEVHHLGRELEKCNFFSGENGGMLRQKGIIVINEEK